MDKQQTDTHTSTDKGQLKSGNHNFFQTTYHFCLGLCFPEIKGSSRMTRYPCPYMAAAVLCPAERDSHCISLRNSRLQLHNRLGSDLACMLKVWTLSHAGFVSGGGWNVWYGWWYHQHTNQNNLLFVNPAENKQAFVVQSELLRLCNQIKQKDKHINEHAKLRALTLKPIIILQSLLSRISGLTSRNK